MTAVNLNRAVRGPVTAVPVVAGKGVRIVPDTVNNRFVVEADETVLWEGSTSTNNITLSESATNFEYIRVFGKWLYNNSEDSGRGIEITAEELVPTSAVSFSLSGIGVETLISPVRVYLTSVNYRIDGTTLIRRQGIRVRNDSQVPSTSDTIEAYKVVGVNRIASN